MFFNTSHEPRILKYRVDGRKIPGMQKLELNLLLSGFCGTPSEKKRKKPCLSAPNATCHHCRFWKSSLPPFRGSSYIPRLRCRDAVPHISAGGGLEHVIFFPSGNRMGIVIPSDFHIFQIGFFNHQPVLYWANSFFWLRTNLHSLTLPKLCGSI